MLGRILDDIYPSLWWWWWWRIYLFSFKCVCLCFLDTGQYVRFLLPPTGRLQEEQAELEAACWTGWGGELSNWRTLNGSSQSAQDLKSTPFPYPYILLHTTHWSCKQLIIFSHESCYEVFTNHYEMNCNFTFWDVAESYWFHVAWEIRGRNAKAIWSKVQSLICVSYFLKNHRFSC